MKQLTSSSLLVAVFLEASTSFAQGTPKVVNPPAATGPSPSAAGEPAQSGSGPSAAESTSGSETRVPSTAPATESAPARTDQYGKYAQESQTPPANGGYAQSGGGGYAQTSAPVDRGSLGPVAGSDPQYASMTLRDLEAKKDDVGLGMPITFLAVGVPLSLLGAVYFIAGASAKNNCNYGYLSNTCSAADVAMVIGGVGMGVGIPLGVIGAVVLPQRIGERRALGAEIERREAANNITSFRLDLSPVPTPGGGFSMGVIGSF